MEEADILRSDNELILKFILCELHSEVDFTVRNYVHHLTISKGNFDKGGLVYPSKIFFILLRQLEAFVTEYFTSEILIRDSIFDILEIIKEIGINYFGCNEHNHALTTNVVKFYLLYRLHFYIKGCNKSNNSNYEKMKYLKLHRLK